MPLSDGSPMTQPTPQHHLPRSAQNGFYFVALAAAPLINLAISINCLDHIRIISKHELPINHWIFGLPEFASGGIFALLQSICCAPCC